jgi:hypothetical protein
MKLKELKEWIAQLPIEFDEFELVNGERGKWNEEYSYRVDKPIVTFDLDEENQEVIFLHQHTDENKETNNGN